MASCIDLRQFTTLLEERGKLYRMNQPINKDAELLAFYRLQMRGLPGNQRKALLFENVTNAHAGRYDMPVLVGCYGASDDILSLGLGSETYTGALEQFHQGLSRPIPPVLVNAGPVQDEVHTGSELREHGLDELPAPVEEAGLSGMIRTGLPMITKDPDTGTYNVGTYNGFFYARDRIVAGIATPRDAMQRHWQAARKRREGLPIAIVIGCAPSFMIASSAQIRYGHPGLDEISLAGGIAGQPVEMVPCKTVPLEVPAGAEAVIEGVLSTEYMEPSFPFGEYPGYMRSEMNIYPVLQVTAITHRRQSMFTPVIVGFWPSDSNTIVGFARAGLVYHFLRFERQLPVEEVYFPQEGGGVAICLIRVAADASQSDVEQILRDSATVTHFKYGIVVDHDCDIRNPQFVLWALSFSTRPMNDLTIVPGGGAGVLDPALAPTGSGRGETASADGLRDSRVLINATRKWPYPPVSLPKQEYMERALELWNNSPDLPKLELQEPWHSYSLGHWPAELEEYADLITRGDYLAVGEKAAQLRVAVTDDVQAAVADAAAPVEAT